MARLGRQVTIRGLQQDIADIKVNALEEITEEEKSTEFKKQNALNWQKARELFLADEVEATGSHYTELLKAESLQAEARKLLLQKNQNELIELLNSYNPNWHQAGVSFGESLIAGIDQIKPTVEAKVAELLVLVTQAQEAARGAARQTLMARTRALIHTAPLPLAPVLPVPEFQHGGIVTRPTVALIGERGPEAVVPLGRGIGTTIVVNGNIFGFDEFERRVAQAWKNTVLDGGFHGVGGL